jgi:hypothetical protein
MTTETNADRYNRLFDNQQYNAIRSACRRPAFNRDSLRVSDAMNRS